jgi:Penicillin-insensitive murein endopeptidase
VWHHRTVTRRRSGFLPGGWPTGEVWLEPNEVLWFGELKRTVQETGPLQPLVAVAGAVAQPVPALRPRLLPPRRRRLVTRLAPTVAAIAAVGLGVPVVFNWRAAAESAVAPPRAPVAPAVHDRAFVPPVEAPAEAAAEPAPAEAATEPAPAEREQAGGFPDIRWRESLALGVPHAGALVDGVRLPQKGPGWVTWDPVLDRIPNRPGRLYGTDALVRVTLEAIAAYAVAHPAAPPVLVGDLSRRGGGEIEMHASHENGLDVDVYYPRRDGRLRPPSHPSQVDVRRAQDLLDRFVSGGAEVIFVGGSIPLRGPTGVVVPYPNHDEHMHVRIPPVPVIRG